ncbi:cellulose biosynthesis protein BcsE [Candidatus Methylospira mobilis]|uniref:cellulose biosynthesis protein BcsE n=1 Tax=Candidatus Methylospira mobilis TaxID=1808979 RepID=UPI0028E55DF4|nr:cellulose biosynthesis protein BcsE [Candidatus Methylospira mobilis]WNV03184.1 cellulose biosynthesis protein BcsE [Candidatus Methylospira mobilis]
MKFSIAKRKHATLNIGIDCLPESVSTIYAGQLYGICVRNRNIRETLTAGTIARAWREGVRAVVISSRPEIWAGLIEKMAPGIAETLSHGKPLVLESTGDYQELLKKYSLNKLLEELDDTGIPAGSLIIMDEAEGLFSWNDLKLVRRQGLIFRAWVREWKHSGLFVFHKLHFESPGAGAIRVQCNCLDGVAELDADMLRLNWRIDHWNTPGGSRVEARSYGVSYNEEQQSLSADGSAMDALAQQLLYAPDEDQVLTTVDALFNEKSVPPEWQRYERFSDLLQAVQHAVAATVILPYSNSVKFATLAETTHLIRETAGRGLKIVIREKNKRLRYNQNMALMQLGANLIVHNYESFSHLLWCIDSLKGQCFGKKAVMSYEDLLSESIPVEVNGYLRPQKFCDFVQTTLDRTHDINIQHALISLDLLPGRSHIDALLAYHPKRKGDVMTADNASLFIFFFACREPDIDTALERSLNVSINDLFLHETRMTNSEDINASIQRLRKLAAQTHLVDYTSELYTYNNVS